MLYASLFGVTTLCLFVPEAMGFGACCCLGLVSTLTLVTTIITGVRRFDSEGLLCSTNDTVYYIDGEEWSFSEDAELMKKLFIVQCVMFIPLCFC